MGRLPVVRCSSPFSVLGFSLASEAGWTKGPPSFSWVQNIRDFGDAPDTIHGLQARGRKRT